MESDTRGGSRYQLEVVKESVAKSFTLQLLNNMDRQEFKNLIQKFKRDHIMAPRVTDITIPAIENAYDKDLRKLLELLCFTNDMDMKIKIFSILAAYLLSKEVNCKTVITYLPLYDEIQNILSKGLSLTNMSVLYFVSALLSFDEKCSDESSLAMYAQNSLRISGCLATMVELFSRDMMYQDSWMALCRSVAETCRGSQLNQGYCSYLVPVCIRKCFQGNMEACLVLQSLLQDHGGNIEMFLDCNGTAIFTKKALHYDICLQLLDTIVQRSPRAAAMLLETDVVNNLRHCLHLYGPESKIGQWSTVLLYHINSWSKKDDFEDQIETAHPNDAIEHFEKQKKERASNFTRRSDQWNEKERSMPANKSRRHKSDDTRELLRNIVRDMAQWKLQRAKGNKTVQRDPQSHFSTRTVDVSHQNEPDSIELFQNIAGEIAYGKLLNGKNIIKERPNDFKNAAQKRTLACNPRMNSFAIQHSVLENTQRERHRRAEEDILKTSPVELSFSFLEQPKERQSNIFGTGIDQSSFEAKPNFTTRQFNENFRKTNLAKQEKKRTNITRRESSDSLTGHSSRGVEQESNSATNLKRFKPAFASTPKRRTEITSSTKISQQSRLSFRNTEDFSRTIIKRRHPKLSRVEKQKNLSLASSAKRQSMSARLFSAINESCTTIVKSVKGIFKGSANNTEKTETRRLDSSCSYSFTNYMRKRDAVLANKSTKYEETTYSASVDLNNNMNTCKTCNETALLRQKLANDENLRETVKKLKYGINLYGCDFKKISKALWPRDSIMTHRVLYHLYRKLLAK